MRVVYYEDCQTKKITRCDRLPDGWSEAQVKDALKKYNANENKTRNAVMTEIEEGSLAAFLFETAERKIRYAKEQIDNLLDAIQQARDAAEDLEAVE